MIKLRDLLAATTLVALAAAPATAQRGARAPMRGAMGQPGIPDSGARPDADNQAVLNAVMRLGQRPIHTLTPPEARQQPTFADGVKEVLRQQGRPTAPPPGVGAQDIRVDGAVGPLHARMYRPSNARGPLPVIVYFHGGGFVIADSMVYDSSARALAREGQAVVISVDYRRAPEAKFPAQHDDALASYRWALANAGEIGGDPRRVALAGESAGGNLAVATAIAARDMRMQAPVHILAVYPVASGDLNTPSEQENANAMPLNRAGLAWFYHHTARTPADAMDPRLNLVGADLRGLAPVTIIAAQIDPLRSDGMMLAQRLRAAGVSVVRQEYMGVTHEFFGADAVIAKARLAQQFAGQRLRMAFTRR